MKPYTADRAEADLDLAMARGDLDEALRLGDLLDRMDPPPPATMLGAALWYAGVGLRVFPCRVGAKAPANRHGVTEATTERAVIEQWWTWYPNSNIGIATGHLVDVIDFDGPGSHRAWSLAHQHEETVRWPAGPEQSWDAGDPRTGDAAWKAADTYPLGTVSTPRAGGLHVYVAATGFGNATNICGPGSGVDYRGLGGYVVAPPSSTPVGHYNWLRRLDLIALDGGGG